MIEKQETAAFRSEGKKKSKLHCGQGWALDSMAPGAARSSAPACGRWWPPLSIVLVLFMPTDWLPRHRR
jgi:hypothetical protein